MTDVTAKTLRAAFLLLLVSPFAAAQSSSVKPGPAESLYLQLQAVGLDSTQVYRIRNGSVDRGAVHISLDDGVIAFTRRVDGHITGAMFKGDGELLLEPPTTVERASLALFTGAAILDERFSVAYFRFNDDVFGDLKSSLREPDSPAEFVEQWDKPAIALDQEDALRLLISFSRSGAEGSAPDRMLHAYIQGQRLGTFEVRYDSLSSEQVSVGQHKTKDGASYYNVWTSFSQRGKHGESDTDPADELPADDFDITQFRVDTDVKPPTDISATATLTVTPRHTGGKVLVFELSHLLDVKSVTANGAPVDFIHNQAVEGSQLAKRGNDFLVVLLATPLKVGEPVELKIDYAGAVLSQAANGLLYVGEHGTWYPNIGLEMASFDLQFRYPLDWTLVATGRRTELKTEGTEQVSNWVSERKEPVAGFNLGKYSRTVAEAGTVTVETYATRNVEKGFATAKPKDIPIPDLLKGRQPLAMQLDPGPPTPSRNITMVNKAAVEALQFYQQHFGPYPYSSLELTQFPGHVSQGWPGLVFLSSYAFLTPDEERQIDNDPTNLLAVQQIIAHETAHQWWGDLVTWGGYRDQWMMEALANYSSLMLLESKNPAGFRALLDRYRDDLLYKNKDGHVLMDAGPVTLGIRLSSSEFPGAYQAISYGRGTWLLHMLRTMLRDGERSSPHHVTSSEELFVRDLRKFRAEYQGRPATTTQLLAEFESDLPRSLWYEGKPSLNWFYDSWLNGTAVPELRLRDAKFSARQEHTLVSGTIVQDDAPDELVTSVPIFAVIAGKDVYLGRVFAEGRETPFHIAAPVGTRKIVLDPEGTILSRVK